MRPRLAAAAALSAALATSIGAAIPASASTYRYDPQRVCRFQDSRIQESSGLASASFSDSAVWTHNDSGDTGRFFLVSTPSCTTVASYSISFPPGIVIPGVGESINALDIEDMARGRTKDGKPMLLLADIGDNQQARPVHLVYELAEPNGKVSNPQVEQPLMPLSLHLFAYPSQPWDAESVAVMPDRRLVIVTKPRSTPALEYTGKSEVYESVSPMGSNLIDVVALKKVGDIDFTKLTHTASGDAIAATAADISQDGSWLIVRTYTTAFEWKVTNGDLESAIANPPLAVPLVKTKQGEGIAYTRTGHSFWTSSEGSGTDTNKASGVVDRYTRRRV